MYHTWKYKFAGSFFVLSTIMMLCIVTVTGARLGVIGSYDS